MFGEGCTQRESDVVKAIKQLTLGKERRAASTDPRHRETITVNASNKNPKIKQLNIQLMDFVRPGHKSV